MTRTVEPFQKLRPKFRKELSAFFDLVVDHAHDVSQFKILFYTSEETVEILNAAAKGFVADLFRMYVERIILGMCKLVEPQQFSVHRMHELAAKEPPYDAETGLRLIASMEAIVAEVAPWRNKLIGHADRRVALGLRELGEFVPAQAIAFYFEHMQAFINLVGRDVCQVKSVAYHDASDLIRALTRAQMFESLRESHPDAWRAAFLAGRRPPQHRE